MIEANTKVRHHLLQIISWPNGDGTFRTILNSGKRLQELGIYDDYKMTIEMTNSEHWKLHWKWGTINNKVISEKTKAAMKNVAYEKLAYWKGKKQTDEQKANKQKSIHRRAEAYKMYKIAGGTLKFNDFQQRFFHKKKR